MYPIDVIFYLNQMIVSLFLFFQVIIRKTTLGEDSNFTESYTLKANSSDWFNIAVFNMCGCRPKSKAAIIFF